MRWFLLLIFILAGCDSHNFRKNTEYSAKYSESKFRKIVPGMMSEEVFQLIGDPLFVYTQRWSEVWTYGDPSAGWVKKTAPGGRVTLVHTNMGDHYSQLSFSKSGIVMDAWGLYLKDYCIGLSKDEVIAKVGNPSSREVSENCTVFKYSRSKVDAVFYELRNVAFDDKGRVISTAANLMDD